MSLITQSTAHFDALSSQAPRLRFGVASERKLPEVSQPSEPGLPEASWLRQRFDPIWELAADVIEQSLDTTTQAHVPKSSIRLAVGKAVGSDQVAIDSFLAKQTTAAKVKRGLLLIYPSTPEAFAAQFLAGSNAFA